MIDNFPTSGSATHRPLRAKVLVVGLGCRQDCEAAHLRELIDGALAEHGLDIQRIDALASTTAKAEEPGLLELARQLGLPLVLMPPAQLAPFDAQLTHRSALAFARTGCHGVAEGAALAAASQLAGGGARLLIPRRKSRLATFALALAGPGNG
ncbi:cobalamin biosynthesis protein [Pseudomonas sp. JDS28PS106]|uniref:cobalamin biosynthesis protein n=1 Tax=Pseudomonas sp. JDS28PS106 TaxID=2497235 RepID=UPI002FD5DEC1